MRVWSAEVVVDEDMARRLIGQFPELEARALRPLAEGWDNAVWVVDERWAFRFPRRAIAIPGIERELATLPRLASLLPLPVPEPVFVGRPSDGYPWPFFGGTLLPGREACDADLDDAERLSAGREPALFLRRLHAIDVDRSLPVDANRRADMPRRVAMAREALAELERRRLWSSPPEARRVLEAAEELPTAEPIAIVHGDLHFRHVLVGTQSVEREALAGLERAAVD